MVIALASIGSESRRRIAVTNIAHTNSGSICYVKPGFRMFSTVVTKFIALSIDEIPAR